MRLSTEGTRSQRRNRRFMDSREGAREPRTAVEEGRASGGISLGSAMILAVLLCAIGTVACGPSGEPDIHPGSAQDLVTVQQGPEIAGRGAANTDAPSALRAAYIASVQRDAPESYRALWGDAQRREIVAVNRAHRLRATFSSLGVTVRAEHAGATHSAALVTTHFGCKGVLDAVAEAAPAADGNRIELRRGGRAPLVEWYVNGPLGIEQGFTVGEPPCEPSSTLEMETAIQGDLTPALEGDGVVALRDARGATVLRVTDLHAHDATGRSLPASIGVRGGAVLLQVDAAGAMYPVTIDPLIATQQAKLLASDGALYDSLGRSVAMSGDTVLAGAPGDSDFGFDSGSAYVFVRSGNAWTQQAKLLPSDGFEFQGFGGAVSLSGDTALIGAKGDDTWAIYSGAAYVFVRSGNAWTQQAKLVADSGAALDSFGVSVSVLGDTALIGAQGAGTSGAAYVFERNGSVWTQQAKLSPNDGGDVDFFGQSVALFGDSALVGAPLHNYDGAAYVFVRSGNVWTQQAKLVADDAQQSKQAGHSVALFGDTALVGAYEGFMEAAFVFVRDGNNQWTQQATLVDSDPQSDDDFGWSVALSADTALVGARDDDVNHLGTVHVFSRAGSVWTEQAVLVAGDPGVDDQFGFAVALSGATAVIGAAGDDNNVASDVGSVYVFTLQWSNGDPCSSDAECVSGFCADQVCCDAACDAGTCDVCAVAAGADVDGTCKLLTGTACDDGSACTDQDTCAAGVCAGTTSVTCPPASDACHDPGACDPGTGTCSNPAKPDGTVCSGGTCESGVCVPDGAGGSGAGGDAASGAGGSAVGGGAAGDAAGGGSTESGGGCGCRVAPRAPHRALSLLFALSFATAGLARWASRRHGRRRRGAAKPV